MAVFELASVSEPARASPLPIIANLTPFLLLLLLLLSNTALILDLLLLLILLVLVLIVLLPSLLVATVACCASLRGPVVRLTGQVLWGKTGSIRKKSFVPERLIHNAKPPAHSAPVPALSAYS